MLPPVFYRDALFFFILFCQGNNALAHPVSNRIVEQVFIYLVTRH